MKILGISHDMFISSAALIENGNIVAGTAEERLSRQKQTREFPGKAIDFCLDEAGCTIDDIDFIASSWNPGVYLKNFNPLFSDKRRFKSEHLYSVTDNIFKRYSPEDKEKVDYVKQTVTMMNKECNIFFITHHRAHAANAFFLSPFENAAILTADSQGELESTTFCTGKKNKIEHIKSIDYPQSLGAFYSAVTEFLGFRPNSDEWKVMALASFAKPENEYYKLFKEHIFSLFPDGTYEFDLRYFQGYNHEQPDLYTEKLATLLGPPRSKDAPLTERHYEIAAAMQQVSEEIGFHMLGWLHKKTNMDNLALSGGFFMNSVFNGKILKNTPFKKLYISSCPDDSGNAIGSALYLYNHIMNKPERYEMSHNFIGPGFDNDTIKNELEKFGLPAEFENDIERKAARMIGDGKLVGWFQGKMEFGQRALGNRSIIADPRAAETKDKVNLAVKYRESFRPFAPAVLEEEAEKYFDMEPGTQVPFMEKVYMIREDKQNEIPAVMHVDGTGRLQTISEKVNPKFYKMINEFYKITGIPIVLNTSFNLNGEPIVCTPSDAIRTFFSCGLDVLIIGNYLLQKK